MNIIDFFNELLESELAQSHPWKFAIAILIFLIIGAGLMWVYMKFIYLKKLENKLYNAEERKLREEEKNYQLQNEFDQLKEEHKDLQAKYNQLYERLGKIKFKDEMAAYHKAQDDDSLVPLTIFNGLE